MNTHRKALARRVSGIILAAVAGVMVAAGCGGSGDGEAGPRDEAQACSVANNNYTSLGAFIRTQFDIVRQNIDTPDPFGVLAGIDARDMADAQKAADVWLASIGKLLGEDISPQLRKALTDAKATIEAIRKSGDQPRPPDPGPQLSGIDGALSQVCKAKP